MEIALLVAAWLLMGGERQMPNPGSNLNDLLKAPFPDWVKVLILGGFLGFSYAGVSQGQERIQDELRGIRIELRHVAANDSVRWALSERNLQRLLRASNQEHKRLWSYMGRPDESMDIE